MALQEIIACIGFPAAGNPTQFVMERAFEEAGVDSRCLTVDVAPGRLEQAVHGMSAMGFRGAVIAHPHHASVCQLVDELAPPAAMLQSADLIYRGENGFVGDHAAVRSILELLLKHAEVRDQNAVVLGTGQVAAAATLALALGGASSVRLMARDESGGESIAGLVQEHTPCKVEVQPWVDLFPLPADCRVVVQANGETHEGKNTSWQLDYESLSSETLLLDSVYHPLRTELLKRGEAVGCKTLNGLDLLVQWAEVAFETWTGASPNEDVVRDAFEEFYLI